MKQRYRRLHAVGSNGSPPAQQPPNRFHYYVAAAWSMAGQSGHMSESITTQLPVIDVSMIRKIEARLASMVQAKDTKTGAAIVGAPTSVVLLNIQLLRAYYEEAPFGEGTSQGSDPQKRPAAAAG